MHDGVVLVHLHNPNRVLKILSFVLTAWRLELKAKKLPITKSLDSETFVNRSTSLFSNDSVGLRRISSLYIYGKAEHVSDLLVVFKFFLRRVKLAKHYFQESY